MGMLGALSTAITDQKKRAANQPKKGKDSKRVTPGKDQLGSDKKPKGGALGSLLGSARENSTVTSGGIGSSDLFDRLKKDRKENSTVTSGGIGSSDLFDRLKKDRKKRSGPARTILGTDLGKSKSKLGE